MQRPEVMEGASKGCDDRFDRGYPTPAPRSLMPCRVSAALSPSSEYGSYSLYHSDQGLVAENSNKCMSVDVLLVEAMEERTMVEVFFPQKRSYLQPFNPSILQPDEKILKTLIHSWTLKEEHMPKMIFGSGLNRDEMFCSSASF